ncbi:glycosyltransferase family 2 protein [Cryobacterium sp. TMS1-20-1]|uniref:glycosyltransferase family 2 protein n=1 Tax=unclassified Cryobacterium TaxID=2649013 RepID=UPI00106D9722|nr:MULTISPECIES: glycosyltransferase family 2 protein [unclassified Cryobacterium]TFC72415.1 glycosyltransferase family 2 protein [Cryobacterium sp. TMS1-20-1]TFD55473.1 glycosyltransferase family 2 protein [Cryobacterium sp. Hh7]
MIAVVTVSHGSDDVLRPFLASVAAASAQPLRIVVVDNKPLGSEAHAIAAEYGAEYLRDQNHGYGHGINAGFASLGETPAWVLVCNPDLVLAPDSIDILRAVGDSDPSIGAVGPRILNADGTTYPSARALPSIRTGLGHALFANIWTSNPWTRRYLQGTKGEPHRRESGWLSGACLLIRGSVFEELNGFDDTYFMYFEDVDLGYRLQKAGYRCIYEPVAAVTHTGAHSTQTESTRMLAAHHESANQFLSRKYSGVLLWPLRKAITAGLWVRSRFQQRNKTH